MDKFPGNFASLANIAAMSPTPTPAHIDMVDSNFGVSLERLGEISIRLGQVCSRLIGDHPTTEMVRPKSEGPNFSGRLADLYYRAEHLAAVADELEATLRRLERI